MAIIFFLSLDTRAELLGILKQKVGLFYIFYFSPEAETIDDTLVGFYFILFYFISYPFRGFLRGLGGSRRLPSAAFRMPCGRRRVVHRKTASAG